MLPQTTPFFAMGGGYQRTSLSSTDKRSGLTLSNSDLTAATSGGGPGWWSARATVGRTSGKFVFELAAKTGGSGVILGLLTQAANVSVDFYAGQDTTGFGYYPEGNALYLGGVGSSVLGAASTGLLAVDLDNRKFWAQATGGSWRGVGDTLGDPTNPASGYSFASGMAAGALLFPAIAVNGGTATSGTMNFGEAAFSAALPAGYRSWNGS